MSWIENILIIAGISLDPIYISLDLQIYSDGGDFDGISGL